MSLSISDYIWQPGLGALGAKKGSSAWKKAQQKRQQALLKKQQASVTTPTTPSRGKIVGQQTLTNPDGSTAVVNIRGDGKYYKGGKEVVQSNGQWVYASTSASVATGTVFNAGNNNLGVNTVDGVALINAPAVAGSAAPGSTTIIGTLTSEKGVQQQIIRYVGADGQDYYFIKMPNGNWRPMQGAAIRDAVDRLTSVVAAPTQTVTDTAPSGGGYYGGGYSQQPGGGYYQDPSMDMYGNPIGAEQYPVDQYGNPVAESPVDYAMPDDAPTPMNEDAGSLVYEQQTMSPEVGTSQEYSTEIQASEDMPITPDGGGGELLDMLESVEGSIYEGGDEEATGIFFDSDQQFDAEGDMLQGLGYTQAHRSLGDYADELSLKYARDVFGSDFRRPFPKKHQELPPVTREVQANYNDYQIRYEGGVDGAPPNFIDAEMFEKVYGQPLAFAEQSDSIITDPDGELIEHLPGAEMGFRRSRGDTDIRASLVVEANRDITPVDASLTGLGEFGLGVSVTQDAKDALANKPGATILDIMNLLKQGVITYADSAIIIENMKKGISPSATVNPQPGPAPQPQPPNTKTWLLVAGLGVIGLAMLGVAKINR